MTARTRTVGILVLLLSLATGAGVYVRGADLPREGPDLKQRPDALEYGVAARTLAQRGAYALPIGGVDYPPRYPPGFPMLAAPFVLLRGGDVAGARDAALCFGVLAILVTGFLGYLAAGLAGAVGAAIVVAFSRGAVDASRIAMSETASMLLVATALAAGAAAAWRRPRGAVRVSLLFVAGVVTATAFLVRYTNLALVVPVLLFYGTRHAYAPVRPARAVVAFGLPVLAGVIAELARHKATFGAWLRDGYHFWVPDIYDKPGLVFSVRYAVRGVEGLNERGNLAVYADALSGRGEELYPALVAAVALLGLLRSLVIVRTCPVARWLLLVTITVVPAILLFHVLYFWQQERFLLPLLPLIAVLAGAGVEGVRQALARVSKPVGVVVAILLIALLGHQLGTPRWAERQARPRIPPPPPLTAVLPGLDSELARDSIVIVNFPVTFAIPALGERREIMVTNRADADPHLNRIALHRLAGKGGRTPGIRSLAAGGLPDAAGLDHVLQWVHERRPAYYVYAAAEAAGGPGIVDLSTRADLVETIARPPFLVYEVRARE